MATVLASALLRTPRDVRLLMEFVERSNGNDRGRRVAEALLAVEGIPKLSECPLTAIELGVVRRLGEGLTYKQVAAITPSSYNARRRLTVSTVRTHVFNAFDKLGIHDRAQLVIRCWEEGWL